MLDIRNTLIIQDLIRELKDNNQNYEVKIVKVIKNGEVFNLEIRIEGKEKWVK